MWFDLSRNHDEIVEEELEKINTEEDYKNLIKMVEIDCEEFVDNAEKSGEPAFIYYDPRMVLEFRILKESKKKMERLAINKNKTLSELFF